MKTVQKVLSLFEVFLKHPGEIGIVELANLSRLNVSTAHRIASALIKAGYLNQHQKREKYSLSPKLLEFSIIIKREVKIGDVAYPFLVELNKAVNESANLSILDRNEAVNIVHVESSHDLRITIQVGARIPLHCTAAGKVLLAHMPEKELAKFLKSKGLLYHTENTTIDVDRLKEELFIIKRDGIAIDNEEYELGVKCVGAPVRNNNGDVVAAVSISEPSARLNSSRLQELKSLVVTCGLEISRAMGYGG